MPDEELVEKSPSRLSQKLSKMRVLTDDINYLMQRVETQTLATIDEHVELQEEIHELEALLADCDAHVTREITGLEFSIRYSAMMMNSFIQKGNPR